MHPVGRSTFKIIAMIMAMCKFVATEAFQAMIFSKTRVGGNVWTTHVSSPVTMVASPPKIDLRPGSGRVKRTEDPYNPDFHEVASFGDAYPASTKEYKEITHAETGHRLRVPFRRIHLSDPDPGCSHIDVYDTAGPLGADPKKGLPHLRGEWVRRRERSGDKVFTQMHYAKKGVITEEMAFVAAREGMDPEFIRYESIYRLPVCPQNWCEHHKLSSRHEGYFRY